VEDSIDAYRVLVGRSVDGRIIWVAWNGLMCLSVGTGAGCCECGKFHDWLSQKGLCTVELVLNTEWIMYQSGELTEDNDL
jgi:hypothetical protein